MHKIKDENVINAYNVVYEECMSAIDALDDEEDMEYVDKLNEALDILYKKLFEEGDC